jgi:hypothetical protein
MMRMLFCLVLILTNTVLAQAADNGTIHISTHKWITTYAGEAEVDGLPVLATLDESQLNLDIPEVMASSSDTPVPSLLPVVRKAYRLNLIVSQNPRVQIPYVVQPRTISDDGAPRFAYVSDLDQAKDLHFIITRQPDGTLHVVYARKAADGSLNKGDFVLSPVPHILAK